MNYKKIGRYLSAILGIEAAFLIPAVIIGFVSRETPAALALLGTAAACLLCGVILFFLTKNAPNRFYAREGMVMTGVAWIVISLFGCLPFVITGAIPHFVDAFFEIVSGFTTTGASILPEVESMPKSLLYWRSFSHWLGGMGVLVFMMAFLSDRGKDTGSTVHILRAESPGPEVEKLVPHMRDSSIVLYVLYVILTVLNIIFLMLGGMTMFEAVCTAFGTAGTGGFGVRNDSIGSFSPYLQNVTTVFMLLFGVNFNIYFLLRFGRFREIRKNIELRVYLGFFAVSAILITLTTRFLYSGLGETIRHAAFQTASIMTTTGYTTVDFDVWPVFPKTILLILMVTGACAGSTGGGIKCSRVIILWRSLRRYVRKTVYPSKVESMKIGGQKVSEEVSSGVSLYLTLYAFVLVISFLLISLDNFSVETNLSAVLATLNNIGPGLSAVGPTANYGSYSVLSKLVLTFDMLAGRLELLPILCLMQRTTWRRR